VINFKATQLRNTFCSMAITLYQPSAVLWQAAS